MKNMQKKLILNLYKNQNKNLVGYLKDKNKNYQYIHIIKLFGNLFIQMTKKNKVKNYDYIIYFWHYHNNAIDSQKFTKSCYIKRIIIYNGRIY